MQMAEPKEIQQQRMELLASKLRLPLLRVPVSVDTGV